MSRFVDEQRGRFGSSRSADLGRVGVRLLPAAWGRRSARAVEDERLLGRIDELHAANYYAYGYRRMWKALRRAGEQCRAAGCSG